MLVISIILPTHNWSKYIRESIDSVLNQSYKDFELIIVNDCSIDSTESIILEYQKNDPRIIYLKNAEKSKLAVTLNNWIKIAKWSYIARIDDDDVWIDRDKLKKQIEFLEDNNDYWLIWTSIIRINEGWKKLWKIQYRENDNSIRAHILESNQFAHPSVVIRKSILDKVWFYNENIEVSQDYDLWLRIWTISKFYNLVDSCILYRVREWSLSWKKSFKQKWNAFKIMIKYLKFYPNNTIWILANIINLILPRFIINSLIKFNKLVRN